MVSNENCWWGLLEMGHSRNGHLCPQTKPYVCIYMCIHNHVHTHIIFPGFVCSLQGSYHAPQHCWQCSQVCRVGIFCPGCPEWRRAHIQWPQTCSISEHSIHRERGKSQRTNLSEGPRVWKAAAVISLKWPLTHGLIKLNALAQKCRWMSRIEYESGLTSWLIHASSSVFLEVTVIWSPWPQSLLWYNQHALEPAHADLSCSLLWGPHGFALHLFLKTWQTSCSLLWS